MDQLSFDGFYVVPIENIQEMPGNVQINGKEYYRQTIQKYLLFPQKSGNFTLGPVNCKIGIATDSGFGGFLAIFSFENIHSNSIIYRFCHCHQAHQLHFRSGRKISNR